MGIGLDPKTEVGRKMLEFTKALDEGRDPIAEKGAAEKEKREKEGVRDEIPRGLA